MEDEDGFEQTARVHEDDTPRGLTLVAIGDGIFLSHALPASGSVTLGRAPEVDLQIDHASISRRHAVLWLDPLAIEDLGSANGTRVRETQLELGQRAPVSLGEVIDLGAVMVTVQRRLVTMQPRRLWTRAYFQARLEEECVRAGRTGRAFALAVVHVDQAAQQAVHELVGASLRPGDIVAAYGPHHFELLFPETTPEDVDAIVRELLDELARGKLAARGGIAVHPADGRSPEELLEVAYRRSRGGDPATSAEIAMIGTLPQLERLVERVAASEISVLLLGETGVGKEVMASKIHALSPRAKGPFVPLDCAAFTETLLESELFGHARGAFTGADHAKPGLLEMAEGGTVLLDEIGELPVVLQAKLLRVLEERKVRRVGEMEPRSIDVRIIAATNRDLDDEVARGRFRKDLYFRLAGISLAIPPLRERVPEIGPLARLFIAAACARGAIESRPVLSAAAISLLESHAWPGNIRELRNVIDRALILCSGPTILTEHLPLQAGSFVPRRGSDPSLQTDERQERERIMNALEQCGGNQSSAAELLGITRRVLMRRLDRYGIARPRKR